MTRHPVGTARAHSGFPVHVIDHAQTPSGLPHFAVEPIRAFPGASAPHRHDFTQVLLVESGTGLHYVDFEPFPIDAPLLFVLARGQVHHWDTTEVPRGRLIIFSDEFLDAAGPLPDPVREITQLGAAPIRPTSEGLRRTRRLFDALEDEASAASSDAAVATRSLITALLVECARASGVGGETHSGLTRAFIKLTLAAPDARLTVTECARRLGVTAGHLSDAVLADAHTTPGRILRRSIAREAQRLLSGTPLSASQISAQLGFAEPSYFSRFFRREVGQSPSSFRAMPQVRSGTWPHTEGRSPILR